MWTIYPIGFKPSVFHKVGKIRDIQVGYLQLLYLGFFVISVLSSGQFRDLHIISQWAKFKTFLLNDYESELPKFFIIMSS